MLLLFPYAAPTSPRVFRIHSWPAVFLKEPPAELLADDDPEGSATATAKKKCAVAWPGSHTEIIGHEHFSAPRRDGTFGYPALPFRMEMLTCAPLFDSKTGFFHHLASYKG